MEGLQQPNITLDIKTMSKNFTQISKTLNQKHKSITKQQFINRHYFC